MTKKIKIIRSDAIDKSLLNNNRQYLVGNLSLPQELEHIMDEKLEIGITSYTEFKSELPHYHTQAYEYQYLISGRTEYLDIDTGEQYCFNQGDFYVTEPGIKYAQRSIPGTVILFIKTPPGNDKVTVEPSLEVSRWLEEN